MKEQIISALVGGVSGALISGVIYWTLEKRKEQKKSNKHKQARKDLIAFLKKLPIYQKNIKLLDEIFKDIGSYRVDKLSLALETLKIMKFSPNSYDYSLSIKSGFHKYGEKDIKVLIKDIKNGNYDKCFEVE